MLEMTTGVIKLLRAEYFLHIMISIMRILTVGFAVFVLKIYYSQASHVFPFLGKIFIICVS
jgi:hypothetical protein